MCSYRKTSQFTADRQNASIWVGEFGLEGMFESLTKSLAVVVAQEAVRQENAADSNEAARCQTTSVTLRGRSVDLLARGVQPVRLARV